MLAANWLSFSDAVILTAVVVAGLKVLADYRGWTRSPALVRQENADLRERNATLESEVKRLDLADREKAEAIARLEAQVEELRSRDQAAVLKAISQHGSPMSAPERAAEYHQSAGFSSTLCRAIVLRTAAHAKALADGHGRDSDAMDMGTAVHQLLLRDDRVDVLDYDSFRTNDAKAERDASRAAGRIPLLRHKWDEANEIAGRVREQIIALELDPVPFTEGTAEHGSTRCCGRSSGSRTSTRRSPRP